jgi:hypothetical protein
MWYLQNLTTDEVVWTYEKTKVLLNYKEILGPANPILLGMFSRTMAEVAIANDFKTVNS